MGEPNAIGPSTGVAVSSTPPPPKEHVNLDMSGLGVGRRAVVLSPEDERRARGFATPAQRPAAGVFRYTVPAQSGGQAVAGRVGNGGSTPPTRLPEGLKAAVEGAFPGQTLNGRINIQISRNEKGEAIIHIDLSGVQFKTSDGRGGFTWMKIPESVRTAIAQAVERQLEQSGVPASGDYSFQVIKQ